MNTPEYRINVGQIEELQMTKDKAELSRIFAFAKSTVIQGGLLLLCRESKDGSVEIFDRIGTEIDLEAYRNSVFKYL